MTKETNPRCKCGGQLRIVNSHGTSATTFCPECGHYSLCVLRRGHCHVIHLAGFHLRRGDAPGQRPLDDLSMARRLVQCLIDDIWPSPATIVDFGIDSPQHLGALQHAVRSGCTAYDLDRVMGDGPAITHLMHSFGRHPYCRVEFATAYDAVAEFVDAED